MTPSEGVCLRGLDLKDKSLRASYSWVKLYTICGKIKIRPKRTDPLEGKLATTQEGEKSKGESCPDHRKISIAQPAAEYGANTQQDLRGNGLAKDTLLPLEAKYTPQYLF